MFRYMSLELTQSRSRIKLIVTQLIDKLQLNKEKRNLRMRENQNFRLIIMQKGIYFNNFYSQTSFPN